MLQGLVSLLMTLAYPGKRSFRQCHIGVNHSMARYVAVVPDGAATADSDASRNEDIAPDGCVMANMARTPDNRVVAHDAVAAEAGDCGLPKEPAGIS